MKAVASKYPEIIDPSLFNLENYKRAYILVVTRCFGWSIPETSLIPLADCCNHFNLDNTYEILDTKLHRDKVKVEDKPTFNEFEK